MIAHRLFADPKIQAAIDEENKNHLRACGPEAMQALQNMIADKYHKDHGRGVMAVLDRMIPTETRQTIDVTHRHIVQDEEDLENFRAMRELGVPREKLIELFGEEGLIRIEAKDALLTKKENATDAEFEEVSDGRAGLEDILG